MTTRKSHSKVKITLKPGNLTPIGPKNVLSTSNFKESYECRAVGRSEILEGHAIISMQGPKT